MVLLVSTKCYPQNSVLSLGLWNLTTVSGELRLGGMYGQGTSDIYNLHNTTRTTRAYGGLILKTNSYIWTPSFVKFEVDGAYYPQTNRNQYLIFPSYYDLYNANRLHLGATFFDRKPITMNVYLNLDESYDSRENLTDIRTNSKSCGGMVSLKYKFLPVSFNYNQSTWDSKEILTGRYYSYVQKNWDSRATKSFGKRDRNELIYIRHDYTRNDYNIAPARNVYDNLELRNNYYLDSARCSYLNSDITGTNQAGVDSYKQFRANETFIYKLPYNLKFNSGYSYINTQRPTEDMAQHNFNSMLSHQLFLSLHTDLLYEYVGTRESTYTEDNNKVGINVTYNKRIPTNGNLSLAYSYSLSNEKRQSADAILQVSNEPYVLADNQIVLLKLPYINPTSIIVKDVTGTIVYQQNFDYVLVQSNNYIEIRRIPGGQIANNATVYLYYMANQPGNIQYNLNSNNIIANVALFGQLINFYFSSYSQNYFGVTNTNSMDLNYLTNNIYGTRFVYKVLTLGAEYNEYRSSIYPYKIMRYYLIMQGNIRGRVNYAVNINSREYLKLANDSTHRLYEDVNGMIAYTINNRTRLDLTAGYQYQDGRDINLSLLTTRVKFTKIIKKVIFSVGADMFDRVYLSDQKSNFTGGFIQIVKKF